MNDKEKKIFDDIAHALLYLAPFEFKGEETFQEDRIKEGIKILQRLLVFIRDE